MKRTVWSISILLMLMGSGRGCVWAQEDDSLQTARLTMPVVGGVQSAVVASCPTDTYLFAWNADYPLDAAKGCFTNGDNQKDGNQTLGTLTSAGFAKTAHNQYVTWVSAAGDGISGTQGTVWVLINLTNDGARTTDVVFESVLGAVSDEIRLAVLAANTLYGVHEGNNGGPDAKTGTDTITPGSDVWVGYTWRVGGAGDSHCVKVDGGVSGIWQCDADDLTDWSAAADDVTIGENATGGAETDAILIQKVRVTSGYQDAVPAW